MRRRGVAILVPNVDTALGGMERQALLVARSLVQQRRFVLVVSTFDPEDGWRPLLETTRDGVRLARVPLPRSWDYEARRALYEAVACWLVALHASRVEALYGVQAQTGGLPAVRIAPIVGRPAVVKLACSGSVGDLAEIARASASNAVLDVLRGAARVVHLNDESREEAVAAGFAPERLVHIPNGIDLARFDASDHAPLEELGFATGDELVLWVGRLTRQKRVSVLVDAFAGIATRRPRARLAIVGDGPELPAVARSIEARGLGAKARLLGARGDVPRLLGVARAFALPSAEEGISNALLEALAAKVPCVASAIPGNEVLVRHGEGGLLVPVDDASALELALERLLSDQDLASRLAHAGRARLEAEFSIDEVARRYGALFDAIGNTGPLSPLAFLARYLVAFENPGFARIALRVASDALRATVTSTVLELKHRLGLL